MIQTDPNSYYQFEEGSYRVLSSKLLSGQDCRKLIELSHLKPDTVLSVLGGRTSLIKADIDNLGSIVLKSYRRGGALRNILPDVTISLSEDYLRPMADGIDNSRTKLRALREMQALETVASLGLRVPVPIAVIIRGKVICREWLVMQRLPEHQSLAELSLTDQRSLSLVMPEVITQVEMLIENKIMHIDLHPGNVLSIPDFGVYLIDFDHAKRVNIAKSEIRDRYLRRWRRAVIKHRLPDELSELFCAGLRRRFVETPAANSEKECIN